MSLKDRIAEDIDRVFLNLDHFATWHTWNGMRFLCVTDEEAALKRKNNNVVDLSWDNNKFETLLYVKRSDFPGRLQPNEHGFLDMRPMKIMSINEDAGMVSIAMASDDPKAVMD